MRRQLLAAVGLAVLLLVTAGVVTAVLVGAWDGWRTDASRALPGDADQTDRSGGGRGDDDRPPDVPDDASRAILERVVDGDTIRVRFPPQAPEGGGSHRVRLLNIDAPELASDGAPPECLADEATARVEELLAPGDVVWLAADTEDRDRFDRLLRGVWTDDGRFVNEVLAVEGLATALHIAPNDRFLPTIRAAVAEAEAAGRGLFGAACPT